MTLGPDISKDIATRIHEHIEAYEDATEPKFRQASTTQDLPFGGYGLGAVPNLPDDIDRSGLVYKTSKESKEYKDISDFLPEREKLQDIVAMYNTLHGDAIKDQYGFALGYVSDKKEAESALYRQ